LDEELANVLGASAILALRFDVNCHWRESIEVVDEEATHEGLAMFCRRRYGDALLMTLSRSTSDELLRHAWERGVGRRDFRGACARRRGTY